MDKRELILQAAITVIARLGFDQATAKDIAQEAGVAVGTLYNHFQDKNAILDAVFEQALIARINHLTAARNEPGSLSDQLQTFMQFHLQAVADNPELHRLLLQESRQPGNQQMPAVKAFGRQVLQCLRDLAEAAVKRDELKTEDSLVAGLMLFHAIHGLTSHVLDADAGQSARKQAMTGLQLLLHGLLK